MGYSAIKNSGVAGRIPIYETETGQIDASAVTVYTVEGQPSVSDPLYVLNDAQSLPKADVYYLSNYSLEYYRDPAMLPDYSWGGVLSNSSPQVLFAAIRVHTDQIDTLHYYIYQGEVENFVNKYNNNQLGTDGLLYRGSYSDYSDNIEEIRDWDEAPSTDPGIDPLNELPQGGEHADVDPWDETVQQFLSDLLEPESLNYGHFMTAYQLDSSNLVDIGDFLFDTNFWTSLKNKFEGLSDPLSMIVSAVEIPFTLGVVPTTFKLGGVEVLDSEDNPIHCFKHSQRYLKYDFQSITLKEVWGTAKDYTDCDINIFLPYVGMRKIDSDLGVNSTLTLAVIVDVWTGDLNYLMQINNAAMQNKYYASSGVPYRWSGNCGNKIPIGKVDPSTPILNVAASLGSMALGAGMFALSGGTAAPGVLAGVGAGLSGNAAMGAAGVGLMASGAKGAISDLNNGFSPIAESSGNISGAIGYMDYQYPYLVIKRGIPAYPNNWRAEFGAPRFQEFLVSSMSGYTEFADIHADAVTGASDDEKAMIEDFMKAGVIL